MQLSGINSTHNQEDHRVTDCIHGNTHSLKEGGMKSAALESAQQASRLLRQEAQTDAQFSLSAWLQNVLRSGQKTWQGIWGVSETAVTGETGTQSGQEQTLAQVNAASSVPQNAADDKQQIYSTLYFQTVGEKQALYLNPVQAVREKGKAVARRLADHLPGSFFGFRARSSFQSKPRAKADLRRRSRYRKDELEIDCILMDDSYLMDSYDRKGKYSKLTTKK